MIEVNLTGSSLFAPAVAREMIDRRGGKIVNIASLAAFRAAPPELMDAAAYFPTEMSEVLLERSGDPWGADIRSLCVKGATISAAAQAADQTAEPIGSFNGRGSSVDATAGELEGPANLHD